MVIFNAEEFDEHFESYIESVDDLIEILGEEYANDLLWSAYNNDPKVREYISDALLNSFKKKLEEDEEMKAEVQYEEHQAWLDETY